MNRKTLLVLGMGLSSLSATAKITLPVDNSAEQFEIPRAEIKNYIQRNSLEENLRPIRQQKPGALADEELLSIPSKYLPPDLRNKQNELRRLQAQQNQAPKKLGKVKSSEYVVIKGRTAEATQKIKLEETVWAAKKQGTTKAVLLPQRRLPSVEVLEEVSFEAGKSVRTEVLPGEPREITLLFSGEKKKLAPQKALYPAYQAYEVKDFASAATLAFGKLTDKKSSEETQTLARFLLAHALFQTGFYASALNQLIPLTTSKWRRSALGMAALAIERTRDDGAANQVLSKVSLAQIPEKYRGTYAFHLGRVLLQTGAGSAALSAFQKVEEGNPRFAEAQYFSGVVVASELGPNTNASEWSREGSRAYQARAFFEEAIRRARTTEALDLLDLAHMATARLAYQLKQFNQAVFHYGEIPNTSPFKKEANFETAWALYRLGEFNRSLGRLHPMGSPYFEARAMPELWVLRSLNYLKLCRFDEANLAANTFKKTSTEAVPQLRKARDLLSKAKFTSSTDFENTDLVDWIKKSLAEDTVVQKDRTRESLFRKEMEHLSVLSQNDHVDDDEIKQDIMDSLKAALLAKSQVVGKAVKPYAVQRVQELESEYQRQMAKLDFLKFEIYSQATKFPDALKRPQAKRLIEEAQFLPGVFTKGHEILWRFDTEYWIDEIAGYDYFIPTECSQEKRL